MAMANSSSYRRANGKMSGVTFIQRLETTGRAPATGCDATTVGAGARVPYTVAYYFLKAEGDDD